MNGVLEVMFIPNAPTNEWASLLQILGLSLWLYVASQVFISALSQDPPTLVNGTLHINGGYSIGTIDEDFVCATLDWWPPTKCDYGTCSWGNASILNLDLSNRLLLNAIKAFSPLKLRLGGTLQDKLRYQGDPSPCNQFVSNRSEMFGFTQGCLPISRWDELNNFFKEAGAKVTFGLNALTGRQIGQDGTCTGAWDSTNAQSLIRHTVNSGYTVYGWELGNELSGSGIGARIAANQYISDVITLQDIVQDIYKGFETKPLVLGPGGFFDSNWFTTFVRGASSSLQVATHHIYNLGAGVDGHLIDKILDPSYLDGGAGPFRNLQNILKINGNATVAWVGEAGGAYNSGRNLVTNAFVFSFWYLDQLGMSASYDSKTYCRQSLIGGNYGLLNTTTFVPNPDYYSALLWHRLMGRNVLSTRFVGTNKIRAYAHCSKNSTGITMLLINLDNTTAVEVEVEVEFSIEDGAKMKPEDEILREEYHLSAKDGNLHSQIVLLNGEEISVNSSAMIPPLQPKTVNPWEPITVAPFSILFTRMPSMEVPACK